MRWEVSLLCAALACGSASLVTPAHAQQGGIRFDFDRSAIQVEIISGGAAGIAEVVDGAAAAVTVTDRGGRGGSLIRLRDETLSLENRSGARVDYLIVVPASASVTLSVDGRTVLAVAPAGGGRELAWSWPGIAGRLGEPAPAPAAKPWRPGHGFTVNAFAGDLVVDSVDVHHPERVRTLKVVLGGEALRVSGNRSVRFGFAEEIRWGVIAPGSQGVDVIVELPADLAAFKLRLGDLVVWELSEEGVRADCEPMLQVRDREGREIWLFTPQDGRLECRAKRGSRFALR